MHSKKASIIIGLIILILGVTGTANVLGRYFFRLPVPDMPTLGEQFMIFVVFFSIAQTQRHKAHVRVDALLDWFPTNVQKVLNTIALILGAVVFSGIAWQSSILAWEGWVVGETSSVIPYYPIWPARFFVTIGTMVMVCRLIVDVFRPDPAHFDS